MSDRETRASDTSARDTNALYKVVVAKKDERTDGPAEAEIVITVPLVDAAADDFDPTVAFMRGKLKASGDTGEILDLLKSGAAATAIAGIVAGI